VANPYQWVSTGWQVGLCITLVLLSLAYGHYLATQSTVLKTKLPNGILDLEVPWSTAGAKKVLTALGRDGIEEARKQVCLDYVFLLLYPIAISLTCALVGGFIRGKLGVLGVLVAWGVLLAGPLDAIENAAMLRVLAGDTGSPWPQLSTACAIVKFSLVFGGLGYVAVGTMSAVCLLLKAA
jgi:hypothetical protein